MRAMPATRTRTKVRAMSVSQARSGTRASAHAPNTASPEANRPPNRARATSGQPDGAQHRPHDGDPARRRDRATEQRQPAQGGQRPRHDAQRHREQGAGQGRPGGRDDDADEHGEGDDAAGVAEHGHRHEQGGEHGAQHGPRAAAVARDPPHEQSRREHGQRDREADVALGPGERRPRPDAERGEHGKGLGRHVALRPHAGERALPAGRPDDRCRRGGGPGSPWRGRMPWRSCRMAWRERGWSGSGPWSAPP